MTSYRFPSISPLQNSFSRADVPAGTSEEEEYDGTSVPVYLQLRIQAFLIQHMGMADYIHEDVYIKLNKILDLQNTLRDISEKNCKHLVMSMR